MDLININYQSDSGDVPIRTILNDNILYFSLLDVMKALAKENEELGEANKSAHIPRILSTVLKTLECDEYIEESTNQNEKTVKEMFVTQPGLLRFMSANDSKSARKFQRWLFHDVVPSIIKHGCYPPPKMSSSSSLSQMAQLLAENSQLLAETVLQNERLGQEVNLVKGHVLEMDDRVSTLENSQGFTKLYLVDERLTEKSLSASNSQKSEIAAWCINLAIKRNADIQEYSSTEPLENKYPIEIIDKAIELVRDTRGL